MNSCLYEGNVFHNRLSPINHNFTYSLFMTCLRLDELNDIFKPFWFWSIERWNLAFFRRRDHLGKKDVPLDQAARNIVEEKTGKRPEGPIQLMTHLCYFGFRFNPVSFYICWNKDGTEMENIIAEINNTPWGEQHCYVFKVNHSEEVNRFVFNKEFHISPFMDMDMKYIWSFDKPGEDLKIHMENWDGDQKVLDVVLNMKQTEITSSSLARVLFQYPFMTVKVMAGIYYQAFRLWMKRCPFFPHPKTKNETTLSSKPSGA